MHLEIVTPEFVLLKSEVKSVNVPGTNGEFQLLDNHAPIVSTLEKGAIKIDQSVDIPEEVSHMFDKKDNKYHFAIAGGVLELKDNKIIILVD
ncbi:MAG: F0F1 ATP synthase subunit epsilon [Bacteroidota bacterium]